jgi:hypothetical protein
MEAKKGTETGNGSINSRKETVINYDYGIEKKKHRKE